MDQIEHNTIPTWIKIKQNGTLGEARTRSFLLERFWILERSIDIEGVDFIIQRRITNRNILDREPPRFGVVQVKFFETENTTHYIHKEYIVDKMGYPRNDFFVTCHTGHDDNHKMFLLTAEEITQEFELSPINNVDKYCLSGKKLFKYKKYEVQNWKNTLDRMENQLTCSDFVSNREFISWNLEGLQISIDAIKPIYKEPIDNWWGDIPSGFREIKETARRSAIYVESIYNKLRSIAEETDPLKVFEIVDEIRNECYGGVHWNVAIPDSISNEDFECVCRHHLEIVNQLKEDGLLDKFIKLREVFQKEVSGYVVKNALFDKELGHRIELKFSLEDFTILECHNSIVKADTIWESDTWINKSDHIEDPKSYKLKKIGPGIIEFYWVPGIYNDGTKGSDYYMNTDFIFYFRCMEFIYNIKYEIETF